MKFVVIGAVAAGMSAASKAKREDPSMEVEVYTLEDHISYAACGLPYYIEGKIEEKEKLIARSEEKFAKQGIRIFTKHWVEKIDPERNIITVMNPDGAELIVDYDKLLIATGASAIMPPLPGIDLENIFTVKNIPEADKVRNQIPKAKKVVIVGGGYIGLEMIDAFYPFGMDITVIEKAPQLMGNIDKEMAEIIDDHLYDKGIKVKLGEAVEAFTGHGKVQMVKTDKGEYPADIVIMAIGVTPNSKLAKDAGIKLGVKNAIKVNRSMETSQKNIYAAGDCVGAYHLQYEDDAYIPLGTTANKQGRVAGENIAGGEVEFQGVIGTGIMKILDLEVGRTGLNTREAEMLKKDFFDINITIPNIASYYPGYDKGKLKLIVEKGTGKVLGGQIVGPPLTAKRIDVIATSIQAGFTVRDMSKLDLAYAPPFSSVWDPVLMAANVAVNELEKLGSSPYVN
ncbi:FAD-dependent oxidoreductase [Alkalicella caledoniensis]|uniref:FAD-dependent oxidoreductase n=1 Tax=Alkalicella caledoniensis TaxID=2731377 RepID=A0A7G9W4X8_ALKCA|nr:FAD-dependent oxidoreductase [Alkalicella caledoniensis]QNO13740.1 FAD-dependent oxidoreductase [Alkalicella caledoniensis]